MWYDGIIKIILQTPLHGMVSSGIMLLKYTGHKSGRRYAVPISFVDDQDHDQLWTVSLRKRTWWRNLRQSAPVTLRFKGHDRLAKSEVFESEEEVREALLQLFELAPVYARYLDVPVDDQDKPVEEAFAKVIEKRVVVVFKLVG